MIDYDEWIGRTSTAQDEITAFPLNALVATLDRETADFRARLGKPDAGILVQEMVDEGSVEVVLSCLRNTDFGPIMSIGTGGVAVELYRDVTHLALPTTPEQLRASLRKLKLWTLLQGFRGKPPADVDALVDAAVRLGDLFLACPEIDEFELNPVIVNRRGSGLRVVDALVAVDRGRNACVGTSTAPDNISDPFQTSSRRRAAQGDDAPSGGRRRRRLGGQQGDTMSFPRRTEIMANRFGIAALALAIAGATAACAQVAQQKSKSALVGAWRMTSLEVGTDTGDLRRIPYSGQIVFTEVGTMSVQAMDPDRNAAPTPYTMNGYEAFYGPVVIDDAKKTFVVTVESSLVRSLIGQKMERTFQVSGDRLILLPADPKERFRVTYERF